VLYYYSQKKKEKKQTLRKEIEKEIREIPEINSVESEIEVYFIGIIIELLRFDLIEVR